MALTKKQLDHLEQLAPDVVIVDEAHRLKGRATQQSKGFKSLDAARWIFFLTATPMPMPSIQTLVFATRLV